MTITIDGAKALELLNRAVDEKGAEYTYPMSYEACEYVRNGEPSCIVAHALFYAGVDRITLRRMDHPDSFFPKGEQYGHTGQIRQLYENPMIRAQLPFTADEEAMELFQAAQRLQDRGISWGESVARAKKSVGSRWRRA